MDQNYQNIFNTYFTAIVRKYERGKLSEQKFQQYTGSLGHWYNEARRKGLT